MSPASTSNSAPGAGLGVEVLGLEVEVGQQLQLHAADCQAARQAASLDARHRRRQLGGRW
jgi:hypothetical protein